MRKLLLFLTLVISTGFILSGCKKLTNNVSTTNISQKEAQLSFQTPKKSAHFETNTPNHGSTLPVPPINVVIDFNFDLAPPSSISIQKDGKEYGQGETTIDSNKLSMRRSTDLWAPDGVYTVSYNACWPDKSCHDGHFQFAIDRTKAESFEDLTNQNQITVKLAKISFAPQNIRIKKGTTVTWQNSDEVVHYINTDSHPAHTYLLTQNSKALQTGDAYSVTFDKPGAYPYHCSAHADSMIGMIVVE